MGFLIAPRTAWPSTIRYHQNPTALQNERMGFHGTISGRVTFKNGRPAKGIKVVARFVLLQSGAPGEGYAVTGGDGRYEIRGLNPQSFYVYVDNENQPYVPTGAQMVDIGKTKAAQGVNYVVEPGPEVTVSVRDAETGRPVAGLQIFGGRAVNGGSGNRLGVTDSKGNFRHRFGYLDINLSIPTDGQPKDYGPAPGYDFNRHITLTKSEDFRWDVKAYEHAFQPRDAVFHGFIVDGAGRRAAGASVRIIGGNDVKSVLTDAKGEFSVKTQRVLSLSGADPGVVIVAQKGDEGSSRMVTAEETWGTIRMAIGPKWAATMKGRVVDERGNPVPECPITFWEFFPASHAPSVQPSAGGMTDAEGRFTVRNLSPDATYTFSFGSPSLPKPVGLTNLPAHPERGENLTFLGGETKDVGSVLVPRATKSLGGVLIDTDGNPVHEKVAMIVKGEHTYLNVEIGQDGRFTLPAVVDEPLTLRVFVGDGHAYRTSDDSPDLLYAGPVKPGDEHLVVVVKMRPAKP